MRDAGIARRASARLLFAAGFAVAGWLLGALLGTATAAADEPRTTATEATQHDTAEPEKPPGLLTLLSNTLTRLVGSVNQVATTVTDVGNAVAEPIVEEPMPVTAPPAPTPPRQEDPQPRIDIATPDVPRLETPAVTPTQEPPVTQRVRPTDANQEPVRHRHATQTDEPAKPQAGEPAVAVDARGPVPVPPPTAPGGQTCGITVSHDTGGNGKNPLAVLGASTGMTGLQPIGVPRQHTVAGNSSRDAALPTTSPD